MSSTNVATRLSRFAQDPAGNPDKTKVVVEVQSEDDGVGSTGGIHLFDASGKYADVPLRYEDSKPEASKDAFWSGTVDLTKLVDLQGKPVQLDPATLQATAWLDPAGGSRIWEGDPYGSLDSNHPVRPLAFDRVEGENTSESLNQFVVSQVTRWGKVDITLDNRNANDYPDSEGQMAVAKVVATDTSGQYGARNAIKIQLQPQVRHIDEGMFWSGPPRTADIMDLNEMNLLTLYRVPGTNQFASSPLPAGQAFLLEDSAQIYEGPLRSLQALKFCFVDPVTNTWDNNSGQNYQVEIGSP